MAKPRLLSHDPATGIEEWWEYDHAAGEFSITRRQNITPLMKDNAELYRSVDEREGWKYGGSYDAPVRVASFPLVVAQQLMAKGILGKDYKVLDRDAYRAWLNDPDNRPFRTRPGKV